MTQVKVSTGLVESLLQLTSLNVRIVGAEYIDGDNHITFTLESYIGESLPEGLVVVQTTKSIDVKLVPA